jgi:hypothetical protein
MRQLTNKPRVTCRETCLFRLMPIPANDPQYSDSGEATAHHWAVIDPKGMDEE